MEELLIDKNFVELITADQAWHYNIVPQSVDPDEITFLCLKNDPLIQEELELLYGKTILLEEIDETELRKLLITYYPVNAKAKAGISQFSNDFNDFLPKIISEARALNSSDIHVETYEQECRIRFRVDGKLAERYRFSKEKYPALVNRIKIQAHLDIAEKRLPQDGRIIFKQDDDKTDIRVSVMPTLYGEKVVLRLLNNNMDNIRLDRLGFAPDQLSHYQTAIQKPHGIILISGPTGSGKTTTLYASLKFLNEENVNIMTVEDPIEYTLDGINQVQVKDDIGFSFAAALRTFLRQDPDIIMLGEIRDKESAQMAIRAALTGHLVFSTVHTNSAYGTISRLLDMDIPPYLVSSTLSLSMAQRLVRLLCPHCKQEEAFSDVLLPGTNKLDIKTHYRAVGCEHCYFTGYMGRKAIYELIPVTNEIAEKIKHNNLSVTDLKFQLLKDSAIELVVTGQTSLEEILSYLL
jgi:general secretion pathway protein E/type IV pilus assembly protein PilB